MKRGEPLFGLTVAVALTLMTVQASARSGPAAFVYCLAPSTSPRGPGLVITAIFPSRSDTPTLEAAFTNYLRTTYAQYGNGWVFPDDSPICRTFDDRRKAETQRNLDISRIPQPAQSVFNVTFQLG